MPKKFEIGSVLLCDEVRLETNGKQMILGLYDDEILVATFPALLPKLTLRIGIRFKGADPKNMTLLVKGKKGHAIINYTGPFPNENKAQTIAGEKRYAMLFVIQPCIFGETDKFQISLGLDGPPRKIAEFLVVLPRNEEERARVPIQT
jgi:hypothetical protein